MYMNNKEIEEYVCKINSEVYGNYEIFRGVTYYVILIHCRDELTEEQKKQFKKLNSECYKNEERKHDVMIHLKKKFNFYLDSDYEYPNVFFSQ